MAGYYGGYLGNEAGMLAGNPFGSDFVIKQRGIRGMTPAQVEELKQWDPASSKEIENIYRNIQPGGPRLPLSQVPSSPYAEPPRSYLEQRDPFGKLGQPTQPQNPQEQPAPVQLELPLAVGGVNSLMAQVNPTYSPGSPLYGKPITAPSIQGGKPMSMNEAEFQGLQNLRNLQRTDPAEYERTLEQMKQFANRVY